MANYLTPRTPQALPKLDLTKCYESEADFEEEVHACELEETSFDVTVKNVGLKEDTYTIIVDELAFEKIITLDSNEEYIFSITFAEDEGEYDLTMRVSSEQT